MSPSQVSSVMLAMVTLIAILCQFELLILAGLVYGALRLSRKYLGMMHDIEDIKAAVTSLRPEEGASGSKQPPGGGFQPATAALKTHNALK